MSLSPSELAERLREAGNNILAISSASCPTADLVSLLETAEDLLGQVEQEPPQDVKDALVPSVTVLMSDGLFRHSDIDVKVSVAACITELVRISAPEAPFGDDKMKEVLQLTVETFDCLSPTEGHCYSKAKSVLSVVCRTRSCLILLDLECHDLIVEMFDHFLKHIGPQHPQSVFSSMETIMTLVIDESEGLPMGVLSVLLASVRKENQQTSPVALKLGENVLTKCSATLEPDLVKAVETTDIDLDDYIDIVVSIYQKGSKKNPKKNPADDNSNEKSEAEGVTQNAVDPSRVAGSARKSSRDRSASTEKNHEENVGKSVPAKSPLGLIMLCPSRADSKRVPPQGKESVSVEEDISGGEAQRLEKEGRPEKAESSRIELEASETKPEAVKDQGKETDISRPVRKRRAPKRYTLKSPQSAPKKRAPKPESATSSAKRQPKQVYVRPTSAPEKAPSDETEPTTAPKKRGRKSNSSGRKTPAPASQSRSNQKSGNSASKKSSTPSAAENVRKRKRSVLSKEADAKSPSEETKDVDLSGEKEPGRLTRSRSAAKAKKETASASRAVQNSSGPGRKRRNSNTKTSNDVGSSGKGKGTRSAPKRKRVTRRKRAPLGPEVGPEIVGLGIMVWWPMDKMFYEGLVESFDPVKKRHKISYIDGDEETLNLRVQKYHRIIPESKDNGKKDNLAATDASSPALGAPDKGKDKADSSSESIIQKEVPAVEAPKPNQAEEEEAGRSSESPQKKTDEGKQANSDSSPKSHPDEEKLAKTDSSPERADKGGFEAKSAEKEAIDDAEMSGGSETASKGKQVAGESGGAALAVEKKSAEFEAVECAGKLVEMSKENVKAKLRFYCSSKSHNK